MTARIAEDGPDAWNATLPLRASRWGGAELPLPSGDYAVTVDGVPVDDLEIESTLLAGLRVAVAGGAVRIAPPIDP